MHLSRASFIPIKVGATPVNSQWRHSSLETRCIAGSGGEERNVHTLVMSMENFFVRPLSSHRLEARTLNPTPGVWKKVFINLVRILYKAGDHKSSLNKCASQIRGLHRLDNENGAGVKRSHCRSMVTHIESPQKTEKAGGLRPGSESFITFQMDGDPSLPHFGQETSH